MNGKRINIVGSSFTNSSSASAGVSGCRYVGVSGGSSGGIGIVVFGWKGSE